MTAFAELLAFITFVIMLPDSDIPVICTTQQPVECIAAGDRGVAVAEADGYVADYHCAYTRAPATSMRPIARPVRVDL